jgi:Protein of unknown function (DUF3352)
LEALGEVWRVELLFPLYRPPTPDHRPPLVVAFDRMKLGDALTRKNIIIASAALAIALVAVGYFVLRRPPRAQMERYVPATALAFIEFDNLTTIVDGLTGTTAWRELAPALDLSGRIEMASEVADLMGRIGLGSDEMVAAGRAQFVIALMGIGGKAEQSEEGASLHLKPQFALIVETHSSARTAERLARQWSARFARRIYKEATEEAEDYMGSRLTIFHGDEPGRQLVAATSESRIVIGNDAGAARACLDAIGGRAPTLADDATLKQMRPVLGQAAAVSAFVTENGVDQLVTLAPLLVASRAQVEPESLDIITSLFEHVSKQAASGLLYSAEFTPEGVTEKYLVALRPQVAEGLSAPMKSAPGAGFDSLNLVPQSASSFTVWSVERAGDLPERALKHLTPRVDAVAGLALREFVINLRKQYGLEPSDSVGDFVGDEVAMVNLAGDGPSAMLVRVKNREALFPAVARYLKRGGAKIATEQYKDIEIASSSNKDQRAAAFVGDYLVLATRDQVIEIADTHLSGNVFANNERLRQAIEGRPAAATIFSYRPQPSDAGELMLALSKLAGVTDGSRGLLEQDSVRGHLARVPPSVSFTEFRDYGIYTETRSAVGNFYLLAKLFD